MVAKEVVVVKEEVEAEAMVGTTEKRLEPVSTVSRRATSCSTAQN